MVVVGPEGAGVAVGVAEGVAVGASVGVGVGVGVGDDEVPLSLAEKLEKPKAFQLLSLLS